MMMVKRAFVFTSLVVALLAKTVVVLALSASDVALCPPIAPHAPPTSVHDLRADDIKVIAALGDSVTAGMLAKNINTTFMTPDQFIEYRGVSWVMGGDEGAPSLANYFKHFQPDLYGYSLGQKPARLCPFTFFCLDSHHDPSIDYLNAAQSGATSKELPEQVAYLSSRIGLDSPYATTWKLVNLFIGFNDASVSCVPGRNVTEYKANVKSALQTLIQNINYAFINIVGIMHYNDLVHLTDKLPDYRREFQNVRIDLLDFECYCCRHPNGGTEFIGDRVSEYNKALVEVAEELSSSVVDDIVEPILDPLLSKKRKTVAVVFQPINPIIATVPPTSLSNMDGYHPNTMGYSYLSKALWNQMYLPKEQKATIDIFNASKPIFCPGENDRLKTYQRLL